MNNTNESTHIYCFMEPIRTASLYIDGIFLVPIIGLNVMTIICCIRYHQLRTCTNIIIVSLAVNDILFGFFTLIPGIWLRTLDNYSDKFVCVFVFIMGLGSFMISLSNLSLLSLERYLAICRPFRYTVWVTYRTTALSTAFCWLVALFLMLLIALFNEWTEGQDCFKSDIIPQWLNVAIVVIAIAFFAISVWCYFLVMLVVKKQSKTVSSTAGGSPVVGRAEIKKAFMMMILFGLFIAFLLPIAFFKMAEIRLPLSRDMATAKCLVLSLVKINYFNNPLVYNSCNKLFRKATLHLISCTRKPLHVPD